MRSTIVSAALACMLAALGCESRVEEPLRAVRTASAAVTSAPAKPSASAAPRCIRPRPEKPERGLPHGNAPDPKCPPDPESPAPLREGRVVFPDAGRRAVVVEVAEKDHERMRGLMYRKAMPDDRGMIFRMDARENHTFWMHNTCLSLDMLFIDDDGVIVGIEENAATLDDSTYECSCPSRYVLEVNGGWTRKHGVAPGQRVILEGV